MLINFTVLAVCSYPTAVNMASKISLYFKRVSVSSLLKSNQISALKLTVDGVFDEMNLNPLSFSDNSKFYPIK